jgi:hypothetical protein
MRKLPCSRIRDRALDLLLVDGGAAMAPIVDFKDGI